MTPATTTGRRDREIAFALDRIGTRGVLVTGEPGAGRTWVARAVAAASRREVRWVVATRTSRSIPFGALAALLPPDLTDPHPVPVLHALRRALGPRSLLVVDDAHLLDEASATTLLALAPELGPRLVVTALLPGPDAVNALARDGFLDVLALEPFGREDAAGVLADRLGGEVAPRTADLLWRWSRGNARDLAELARHSALTRLDGVWMWRGDTAAPPVAAQPVTGLSAAGVEALCALVLAEPVAVDVLTRVASPEGFAEIEERGLVDGAAGIVRPRHPMLAAAAAPHLTPSRRRRLADRLLAADPGPGREHLLLDSGVTDPAVLVAAARTVLLDRPELAVRLADRAVPADPGPAAALVLADAHAESGARDEAWKAHRVAAHRVRDDADRLAVLLTEASLTIWCDRRPSAAVALLDDAVVPDRFRADVDSAAAVAALFSARPADALLRAEKVLTGDPPATAWGRAMLVSAAALVMADRPGEAAEAMAALTAASDVSPYYRGLARSVASLLGPDVEAPSLARVREALLAQSGRGAFRSEVTANLVVAEAAAGVASAREPDEVAVLPALAAWVAAATAAVRGEPAAELYLAAAREAEEAGSVRCAVYYLAAAAEHGAVAQAAGELGDRSFEAPETRARALGVRARASRAVPDLLVAAQAHRDAGMPVQAAKFTELAQTRHGLTRRELEVVRHAARGLTDRAIADALVVSVRTVESHLAAAYRKLAITSRQGLAGLFT
ncbi:helix-turn-helix transcriptional regulator [Lentzea sp. NPDC003310]|uniref:helix-turn-helix transcriptional regulator n=1 Tax=Lentzea sp. NPDC003310 TaxID=3154447 RepID=UPI0033A7C868